MHNIFKTGLSFLIIGIFVLNLCSCAKKQLHLAVDASVITKGQTKSQVIELIGGPDYITHNEQGEMVWYYYHDITSFWHKIPLMGRFLAKERIEAIQLVFYHDHVSKVVYYVITR